MEERDIFIQVIQTEDPAQGAALVEELCGQDQELRRRVKELLVAHGRAVSFLESPPADLVATIDNRPISEQPGTVIGPYKLLQQIGEGGMGVVFMAEQTEPIQRTIALKIIKPGMDTRQVIARFEAERQAVAMMDHPNIAKVLDAGTTESGRPYFVMELVKGVPITKYCDDKHLPIRNRLELFMQVCQGVQHAHQKGIIHRDIKPNNVLVAEYDNHAVPKVIDFGVAKATAQKLTERTMFTEFGQVLGTMEYMSPEQSKFNQLDIDTRSDIYSLGVMLYELLAGSTPFGGKRLHEAAFDEMLRIIREEEPPKPSTRLTTSDTLASIAANRHIDPARLSKDVRGDLDWIVMKALEKDRSRRYETANGFATDVHRYLSDEVVHACPPSAAYRFRKFARRNRVAIVTTSLIAAALLLGILWNRFAANRASRINRLAEIEADRTNVDGDFAIQGEYSGDIAAANGRQSIGIQVVAVGYGKLHAVFYPGGLPGDGWDKKDKTIEADGRRIESAALFKGDAYSGTIGGGTFVITDPAGKQIGSAKQIQRQSPTLGAKPPQGAIILFDGQSADQFREGAEKLTASGLLMPGVNSKRTFGSGTLHIEFRVPYEPMAHDQGRGNSGCYLQGRYEVQILDSFGLPGRDYEAGGIYGISPPALNMCFPPLTWQTYDIDFTAAQYQGEKKVKNARMTVRHNGVLVQQDVEVPQATIATPVKEGPSPGPLYLQDHYHRVRFQNVWFVES